MKKIDLQFVQEGEKLLVAPDPSQITSFVHAEEILRDVIAQWVKERRNRGLVIYEPCLTKNDNPSRIRVALVSPLSPGRIAPYLGSFSVFVPGGRVSGP
jgi:hypothetical protein